MHARAADDVEIRVRRPAEAASGYHSKCGRQLEAFGKKGAQDDDIEVAKVYGKAGCKVSPLDIATVGKWRDIARDTAWKDYSTKTTMAANLLKLASNVSA